MAYNYNMINYLTAGGTVTVGASATETALVSCIELSAEDSLNFRVKVVCSDAKEVTGITWKLQQSFDGTNYVDVHPAGTLANVSVYGFTVADADVTTATEKITEASHGLETGDPIRYYCSGAGVITGLTSGTTYYAIDSGTNDFQVATTRALAIAGTAIDLTQPAGADTHYFTKLESELILNIQNTTDEPILPLANKVRIVASTGVSDVFTVSAVYVSQRVPF